MNKVNNNDIVGDVSSVDTYGDITVTGDVDLDVSILNREIFTVGNTSDGLALVTVADTDIDMTHRATYGEGVFNAVMIDADHDRIICVGESGNESPNGLIVVIDKYLNVLNSKVYRGGDNAIISFTDVMINDVGNIICTGYAQDADNGTTGRIVCYDTDLNRLNSISYGEDNTFIWGVTATPDGNMIVVGNDDHSAIVVKLDGAELEVVKTTRYGGGSSAFHSVTTNADDGNVICVGRVSEGTGSFDALLVKYDSDLIMLAKKVHHGGESFHDVLVTNDGDIVCAGNSNTDGIIDAIAVKFNYELDVVLKGYEYEYPDSTFTAVISSIDGTQVVCTGYQEGYRTGGLLILIDLE